MYLWTHISHTAKNKWLPHTPTVYCLHLRSCFGTFSQTCLLSFFTKTPFSPISNFLLPFLSSLTLCVLLHRSTPPSRFCCTHTLCVTLTLSLLSPVPSSPHVTPIYIFCMFCDNQTIFLFPWTRQYQNSTVTVENGCFLFPEWVCFSL